MDEEKVSMEVERKEPMRTETRPWDLAAHKNDEREHQHRLQQEEEEPAQLLRVGGGRRDVVMCPSVVVGTEQEKVGSVVAMSLYSWTGVWEEVKENTVHVGTVVFEMATGLYLWRLYKEHAVVDAAAAAAGGVLYDASVVKAATAS